MTFIAHNLEAVPNYVFESECLFLRERFEFSGESVSERGRHVGLEGWGEAGCVSPEDFLGSLQPFYHVRESGYVVGGEECVEEGLGACQHLKLTATSNTKNNMRSLTLMT